MLQFANKSEKLRRITSIRPEEVQSRRVLSGGALGVSSYHACRRVKLTSVWVSIGSEPLITLMLIGQNKGFRSREPAVTSVSFSGRLQSRNRPMRSNQCSRATNRRQHNMIGRWLTLVSPGSRLRTHVRRLCLFLPPLLRLRASVWVEGRRLPSCTLHAQPTVAHSFGEVLESLCTTKLACVSVAVMARAGPTPTSSDAPRVSRWRLT